MSSEQLPRSVAEKIQANSTKIATPKRSGNTPLGKRAAAKVQKHQVASVAEKSTAGAIVLTLTQVARRYSVSRQTIWRWSKQANGFPIAVRIGAGLPRWYVADLEAYDLALRSAQTPRACK